jgi:ATP-dependent DNA helicase RecG
MTHELHLQDKFLIPFFREGLGYRKVKPNTVTLSASLFHLMRAWRVISTTLTDQATGQVTMQATMQAEKVLQFCIEPRSRNEIQSFLDLKNRDYFRKEILNPLIKEGKLALTIPDKPKSPKQRYITRNEHKGNE